LYYRGGEGLEEFGNMIGEIFICPLGYKHSGAGYCIYTGSYTSGYFHGHGEFKCQAGPFYKGQWKMGKKNGKVSVVMFYVNIISIILFLSPYMIHPIIIMFNISIVTIIIIQYHYYHHCK